LRSGGATGRSVEGYRYYVSHRLITRGRPKEADLGRRVPAVDLETLVEDRIVAFLGDAAAAFDAVSVWPPSPASPSRAKPSSSTSPDGTRN
jgi:hypothetical protein